MKHLKRLAHAILLTIFWALLDAYVAPLLGLSNSVTYLSMACAVFAALWQADAYA